MKAFTTQVQRWKITRKLRRSHSHSCKLHVLEKWWVGLQMSRVERECCSRATELDGALAWTGYQVARASASSCGAVALMTSSAHSALLGILARVLLHQCVVASGWCCYMYDVFNRPCHSFDPAIFSSSSTWYSCACGIRQHGLWLQVFGARAVRCIWTSCPCHSFNDAVLSSSNTSDCISFVWCWCMCISFDLCSYIDQQLHFKLYCEWFSSAVRQLYCSRSSCAFAADLRSYTLRLKLKSRQSSGNVFHLTKEYSIAYDR
jgi:hypothetical protein